MECRRCHFENPEPMRYCVDCGTLLVLACPQCSAEMSASYRFCGTCGAALSALGHAAATAGVLAWPGVSRPGPGLVTRRGSARGPTPDGERKEVTVLCCELVTPADLAAPLSPDFLHLLLSQSFELALAEVERYEGTIIRILAQGFMALFGAPVAQEDHAQRAVLAALGLSRRMAEHSADMEACHGVRWTARMGLDTGDVVTGGPGALAVGEATSVAAHLQRHAGPGAILISAITADRVEADLELEPEVMSLEDGTMTKAWRIAQPSGLVARRASRRAAENPFVGRDRELAVLEEIREQASRGQGQVVGIRGDAGSGKSRLLHEFFRRTGPDRRASYLGGHCLAYGNSIPCLPLIEIVESLFTEDVIAEMRAHPELVGTDPEEALPYLLRLLRLRECTESLDESEPAAIQERTFSLLRRMLLDASQRSLVIMEIENLQWIDETSEEFLATLVESMGGARLMLLFTYRSGYQPRWLDKSYATQITMGRLSEEEGRQLMGSILERSGLGDDRVADLAGEILAKAESNPLFLEELTHSLSGQPTSHGRSVSIPKTLQGILMARIDQLPEEHKHLLKVASVLGREFSLDLLEALWDRPEPVEPLLEGLRRREFLCEAPSEGCAVHFFKHALTQEAACKSLLSHRRQELHRRAAQTLETLHAEHLEDVYGQLIYHLQRAGEPEKVLHYLTLFASRSAKDFALDEAARTLCEALSQVEKLPPEVREWRLVDVLLQTADLLLPLAGFPEALEPFQHYAERIEELEDPSQAARYYFWLAHTHSYLGNLEATTRFARLSIAAAQARGDETTEGKARFVLGRHAFWSGQFSEGIRYCQRAVVLLERGGEPWWQGQAHWMAGFNHYALGEFEKSVEALESACSIGEALEDERLDTSWSLGYVYASLGEWESGIEHSQRGLDRSRDTLDSAVAMGALGYAYLEKRDVPKAIEILGDSVHRLRETGLQQVLGWFSVFLGEAYLLDGQLDKARRLALQGLEITRDANFLYGFGLAQRSLGRISASIGDTKEAESCLEEALETFSSIQVPFEVARTYMESARLAHAGGDDEEAARRLLEARRLLTALRVPKYLARAEMLADELGLVPVTDRGGAL